MKDLKEFINLPHLSLNALYRTVINELGGVEKFIPFMPCNKENIIDALNRGDIHLNHVKVGEAIISQQVWDSACGFGKNRSNKKYIGGGVVLFLASYGISATQCECVCMLKTAALMWAESSK